MNDDKKERSKSSSSETPSPNAASRKKKGRPRKAPPPDASPPATPTETETLAVVGDGIVIDEELSSYMPPHTPEELAELEQQLLAEGCHDAIVVWSETSILLDGHHRLEICKRHGIKYKIRRVSLPNQEAAKLWIIAHQLGRRNWSPEAASYFRGKLYNAEKHQGKAAPPTSGQNAQKQTTAEKFAHQHNVDEKTIRREGKFAQSFDALFDNCGDDKARRDVLAGVSPLTRQKIQELAGLPPKKQKKALAADLKAAKTPRPKPAKPTDVDILRKAWDNAKEEGKKSFLEEILGDEGTVSLIEDLGWALSPPEPRDSEEDDDSTDEEAGVEEEDDDEA